MIERRHTFEDRSRGVATFSDCDRYRFTLERMWGPQTLVHFCMLNPSTADECVLDPTINRCVGFAKAWGAGGIIVTNLWALRATDPKVLYLLEYEREQFVIENNRIILEAAERAALTVCAWGVHGELDRRGNGVRGMLDRAGRIVMHLGLTKHGHPRHPLYLKGDTRAVPWV